MFFPWHYLHAFIQTYIPFFFSLVLLKFETKLRSFDYMDYTMLASSLSFALIVSLDHFPTLQKCGVESDQILHRGITALQGNLTWQR